MSRALVCRGKNEELKKERKIFVYLSLEANMSNYSII
jgi:hypothetical protein